MLFFLPTSLCKYVHHILFPFQLLRSCGFQFRELKSSLLSSDARELWLEIPLIFSLKIGISVSLRSNVEATFVSFNFHGKIHPTQPIFGHLIFPRWVETYSRDDDKQKLIFGLDFVIQANVALKRDPYMLAIRIHKQNMTSLFFGRAGPWLKIVNWGPQI